MQEFTCKNRSLHRAKKEVDKLLAPSHRDYTLSPSSALHFSRTHRATRAPTWAVEAAHLTSLHVFHRVSNAIRRTNHSTSCSPLRRTRFLLRKLLVLSWYTSPSSALLSLYPSSCKRIYIWSCRHILNLYVHYRPIPGTTRRKDHSASCSPLHIFPVHRTNVWLIAIHTSRDLHFSEFLLTAPVAYAHSSSPFFPRGKFTP